MKKGAMSQTMKLVVVVLTILLAVLITYTLWGQFSEKIPGAATQIAYGVYDNIFSGFA